MAVSSALVAQWTTHLSAASAASSASTSSAAQLQARLAALETCRLSLAAAVAPSRESRESREGERAAEAVGEALQRLQEALGREDEEPGQYGLVRGFEQRSIRLLLRPHLSQLRSLLVSNHVLFLPALRALAPELATQLLHQASRARLRMALEGMTQAREGGWEESLLGEARGREREERRWSADLGGEEEEEGEGEVEGWIAGLRSRQLFDLIATYPSSIPALEDLRDCLPHLADFGALHHSLLASLHARLLNASVPTSQIIEYYVHLIRGLRLVDASGLLLSHVIGAVRATLRRRGDTIAVLVAALLGNDPRFGLLRADMDAGAGADIDMDDSPSSASAAVGAAGGSVARDYSAPDWLPRPVHAGAFFGLGRAADVVQMLVGIFEDRAGFAAALERSTARSILEEGGYKMAKQLETNLILKRRFGDALLARCDVMLDDISVSRRLDLLISSSLSSDSSSHTASQATHARILSRQFWPDLIGDGVGVSEASEASALPPPPGGARLKMPGQLGTALEEYAEAFRAVKPGRKLRWIEGRGQAQVTLEMADGRVLHEKVGMLQAAVVELAASDGATPENPLSASAVSQALGVSEAAALEALGFWSAKLVLRRLGTGGAAHEYVLLEHADAAMGGGEMQS